MSEAWDTSTQKSSMMWWWWWGGGSSWRRRLKNSTSYLHPSCSKQALKGVQRSWISPHTHEAGPWPPAQPPQPSPRVEVRSGPGRCFFRLLEERAATCAANRSISAFLDVCTSSDHERLLGSTATTRSGQISSQVVFSSSNATQMGLQRWTFSRADGVKTGAHQTK